MSNGRHRPWVKLAALGLPLYLSGCGGAAMTAAPAAEPVVETPAPSGSATSKIDFIGIAERLRANGDTRNAIAMYHQAHLANPRSVAPLIGLGDALMELGASADAADAYAEALALAPKNPDALLGLGITRVLLSQPQFAITQFESALAVNDRDIRAYNGLGVALDMTGAHRKAQETYRAALEIEPDNAKILNNLGLSLALSGESEAAIGILQQVNATPAATPLTRQNLALAYGLSGRLDAAERVARIDLHGRAVERNLAFYAAHQAARDGATLARALGVQRNGVHYTASHETAADIVPDPYRQEPEQAPSTPPAEAVERSVLPPPRMPATGAPASDTPVPLLRSPAAQPKNTDATPPPPAETTHVAEAPRPVSTARADLPSGLSESEQASNTRGSAAEPETLIMSAIARPGPPPLYRIQLAAYRSADEATAGWRKLTAAASDLIGDFAPVVRRVDLGPDKGIYFRLQTGGFADRQAARALCGDLLARHIDCLVAKVSAADADGAASR